MTNNQQPNTGLVKMLFPTDRDIYLAATSATVFFPAVYLRFLVYPGVCFAIGILINNFSLYNLAAIILLWFLAANYREFSHYTGRRRKLLKTFCEDFIEKYPSVVLTEIPEKEIEKFYINSYYLEEKQRTFSRPGFSKEVDMYEQRVTFFIADYSKCQRRPSAQLSFSTYAGTSFVVFNEKLENLGDPANFFLHHEIGHSSSQGKEKLFAYFPYIFLLLNALIFYYSGNSMNNVYFLAGSASWVIAKVFLHRSRSVVNYERAADVYAVLTSGEKVLHKIKTLLSKYPKLLFDERMSVQDNNLRRNYLLELIENKFDKIIEAILNKKKLDWLQISQNEQTRLIMPSGFVIGFSLFAITTFTMFILAGLSLNQISGYTILLYVVLFIIRAIFVTTAIVYEKKIKEQSGLPIETNLLTKSKVLKAVEIYIKKDENPMTPI